MTSQTTAFIAIGSNIEPEHHIEQSLARLNALPGTQIQRCSSWYRTKAWGIEEQPDFVNLVVELSTPLSPSALLNETQGIESDLGRVRHLKNGPRTIDLDILIFGDRVIEEADLRIPHPGLAQRDFMLIPLIEIAPDTLHPVQGCRMSALTDEIIYRQILESIRPGDRAPEAAPHPLHP
ncbi:2-amino-4-hydroxy-6-hydroxymethyldihydropteridine pyrophosphokinase [Thiorhodococcus drewsii AZ1]|uniref:2-amino-4-hydroxy-6-hydroxymethyldihydropteridine pyrophosphokinase n=1 Tax=Thiorhodococcus drewsii AZ1 TaxID=765913 RepID=G2DWL5_9GAMM|nr:2-amino-4-hydroxy-6-hydroxymethyldihydropteridine diphosphokinase [Thiorhodococcus drewsii]EGV33715.1 2-amino-4-hydroxy-6-hydroxymethyldihydropteridine pyrophosphokinase [Thiorhodococcus drewsii AZ1]